MSRLFRLFTLTLSTFAIFACEKEDDTIIAAPTVSTMGAEVPPEGGAVLIGELTKPDVILNHGFQYSKDSLFRNGNFEEIALGIPSSSGEFRAKIEQGLRRNDTYYFKAFITVEDQEVFQEVFDETNSFVSNGNIPPMIETVYPEQSYLEDTVTIRGKYFGKESFFSKVYFNEVLAQVLSRNDSLIRCIVPSALDTSSYKITVTANQKSDSINHSLYRPIIDGVSSLVGTFRDTISVFGQHFDSRDTYNLIYLNELSAKITFSSRTQIDFVVHDELFDSLSSLRIYSQTQWVESSEKFRLLAPIIDAVPNCTFTDQSILIEGANFHPILDSNKVFIENIEAEVRSGNVNSLSIEVPTGPFPREQAEVRIEVASYNRTSAADICISDPWIMVSNTLPFSYYGDVGTFSISDHAYVISDPIDYSDSEIALWRFSPSTNEWTKNNAPFTINNGGTCTANDVKGYLYNASDNNNFWEYDPLSNQWTQKSDFPGEARSQAVSFAIGDEIYVGSGVFYGSGSSSQAYCDFYKYNPSFDTWSEVSDLPVNYCYNRIRASTFVINNFAYLTGGASNTGMDGTWRYNPSTDEWIEVASFPDARNFTSSFSLNGKGYVANGSPVGGSARKECWEYNPSSNSWIRFYDVGDNRRYGGFAFTINGTAYVGGGSSFDDGVPSEMFKLSQE